MNKTESIGNAEENAGQFRHLSLAVITVLIISVITLYHFWQKTTDTWKFGMEMPGPQPLPILGNAHIIIGKSSHDILEFALEMNKVYGNVGRGFLGYKLVVFLTDPKDIELILNSNVHLSKSQEYKFFEPWLGDGLLISSGEKWRSHRKLIAPTFHQYVLKSFVGAFNKNSWRIVKLMKKEVGREFDIHDYMSEVTVDILLETAMGHPKTHDHHEGFEYAMAVMKLCDILHKRHSKFYLRPDIIFTLLGIKRKHDHLISVIQGLTERVFRSKKEKLKDTFLTNDSSQPTYADLMKDTEDNDMQMKDGIFSNNSETIGAKRRMAFLDLMIESTYHGHNITEKEIKEEVDTIMFEGHDTTAACASFVLCLLACHPEIQNRVYEEQKAIFENVKRAASFFDTTQMHYLERVILETIRLYPPVPVIAREVHENVKLASQPFTIPSGATVVIGVMGMHRRKDIYENPRKFDPDNFLPERTQNRNYYSYIPFSAGPRNCVGRKYAMLKLKILLSTICRNYRLLSNLTEADFVLQGDIILKRTDGFRIQIEPR